MADQPKESVAAATAEEGVSLTDVPVLLFIRGLALVLVMVAVVVGLHWYVGARFIRDAAVPEPWATALWGVLWGSFASIFGGFIGGRALPRRAARVLQWVGFVWMGAFGLLLTGAAASDLVLWVAAQVTAVDGEWLRLRALVVSGLVLPAMAWGAYVARRPKLRRLEVPIAGLGKALDGLRVVQLSDVHIGETLGRAFAEQVTARVNALAPDLVVVTGDLVDGSVRKLKDEVAPFAGLAAKHGVFFVTGNHEYYHGAAAWEAEARRLGMTVLHNEHRVVQQGEAKLVVGGVPDVEGARFAAGHRPRADLAFLGAPEGAPRILLAHQPRFAKHAAPHGVKLMLSGHTHGGQMFPFSLFVRLQQPVIGGFATIAGVPTYTSNGTGYWGPPFRLGPRGEITLITLRAA